VEAHRILRLDEIGIELRRALVARSIPPIRSSRASIARLAYRAAHIHLLLLGFVTGMIFGVGYHVFPRFAGRPLRSPGLVMPHWWLANLGVAAMAAAFVLRAEGVRGSPALLGAGGAAAAIGAYLFAYNIWRTLDAPAGSRAVPPTGRPALPVVPG
jgi:cbb3-type cytochrome oxidase subunit 1